MLSRIEFPWFFRNTHENYRYDFEVHIFRKVKCYIFFLSSVEGLHAIVVSDRDGVPVIKGKTENLTFQCCVCFRIKMYLHLSSTEASI